MAGPPLKKPVPSTEMARKYGVFDNNPIRGTGKSGLTPFTPEPHKKDSWRPDESWKYWENRSILEDIQAYRMLCWTARELKAMKAHAAYWDRYSASMSNPIHPIWELGRWERVQDQYWHLAPIPIGSGIPGYWEAQNPAVWKILQPSLQFASLCLENYHIWPCWDALIHSDFHEIYETDANGNQVHRISEGRGLYKIKKRHPDLVARDKDETRDWILSAAEGIEISFGDGMTNPRDDLPCERLWGGVTFQDMWTGRTLIRTDYHALAPLLLQKLTKGEELALQWSFGIMLVHELAHALWIARLKQEPSADKVSGEPYFEDEAVSELGNSIANSLTNGCFFNLWPDRGNYGPMAGIVRTPWPTKVIQTDNPTLYEVGGGMLQEYAYAVPIDYFWLVQQGEYWQHHVSAFGSQSLYFEPLHIGKGANAGKNVVRTRRRVNPIPSAETINKSPYIWGELRKLHKVISDSWTRSNASLKELSDTVDRDLEAVEQKGLDPVPRPELEVFEAPERHEAITELLITYRVVLAIHTQDFPIPELTFLAHVNRLGVLHIERGEWRQYLQYMTWTKKELLIYTPYPGGGTVSINLSAGWPQLIPLRAVPTQRPPDEHINLMRHHMTHRGDLLHYSAGSPDVDKDAIQTAIQGIWKVTLTEDEFITLVRWFIYRNEYWRDGPPGVMRLRPKFDFLAEDKKKLMEEGERDRVVARERAEAEAKAKAEAEKAKAEAEAEAKAKAEAEKAKAKAEAEKAKAAANATGSTTAGGSAPGTADDATRESSDVEMTDVSEIEGGSGE